MFGLEWAAFCLIYLAVLTRGVRKQLSDLALVLAGRHRVSAFDVDPAEYVTAGTVPGSPANYNAGRPTGT
ncbi:hypothetical protein [Arthrobacter ramosus]|uniref:Uncharacterized protein n=1 Tax=Arthrobacter ramosus TaxID=1672 RepID=A0ABV5Y577_ARTRM|nr:hypothetical protein [Arthrobacter ramosus]